MSAKAVLLLGLLAIACEAKILPPECSVHWVGGKSTEVCTMILGTETHMWIMLYYNYTGWVGVGFRPKDSQHGMNMTDFVVIEQEGTSDTRDGITVRDMYAGADGKLKDDDCASDWTFASKSVENGQHVIMLQRTIDVVDTNQDHAFVQGNMTFLLAHGGATGDRRLAYHGDARKQWATAAEPTAPNPNFGDKTKPAICATPAPPTPGPTGMCVDEPCGPWQECVEEFPTFVCVCKINATQRATGKQVERPCKSVTTDGTTTTTIIAWGNRKTTTTSRTPATPAPQGGADSSASSDGLSGGTIAGIVVGVVVGLAVVGMAVWFIAFRSAGGASASAAAEAANGKLEPMEPVA